jgi:hypothetical protein
VTTQLKWDVKGLVPAAVELTKERVQFIADDRDLVPQLLRRSPRPLVVSRIGRGF